MENIFSALDRDYDAYDEDIAILNIYFDTSTVMQFGTQASQVRIMTEAGSFSN
jgi:hypothetical protein